MPTHEEEKILTFFLNFTFLYCIFIEIRRRKDKKKHKKSGLKRKQIIKIN